MKMNNILRYVVLPVLFILFILSPLFELKVLLSLALVMVFRNTFFSASRFQTGILLSAVCIVSYIYSPYWLAFEGPILKIAAFSVLLLASGIWAYFSSSDCTWGEISLPIFPLSILTGLIYLINFRPLSADIPWRGDEDVHIVYILNLLKHIHDGISTSTVLNSSVFLLWGLALIVLFVFIFRTHVKQSAYTIQEKITLCIVGGISFALPAFLLFQSTVSAGQRLDILSLGQVLRYPYVEKWMNIFFLFPNSTGDIRLYRIVPFLSTVLLAWYLFIQFEKKLNTSVLSLLLAFAFISIPLLYFYTSLLYLEMPVVLLLTYCVFNIKDILTPESEVCMRKPVWFALLIMSFLKETVFILLLLLLTARFVTQVRRNTISLRVILSEMKLYALVSFPSLLYLFFRKYFSSVPEYGFQPDVLRDWNTYITVGKALVVQFGPLFFAAVAGCIVIIRKRERSTFFALLFLFTGTLTFFVLNSSVFIGYARWHLFVVPIVFYFAYAFFISAGNQVRYLFLCIIVAGNILLSPIGPEGVRISNWGSPNSDTAEYSYPYDEAIRYLKSKYTVSSLLMLGQYYPYYGMQFYGEKYGFHPSIVEHPFDSVRFDADMERTYLSQYLDECRKPESETSSVDAILYHSVNNISLDMNATYCGAFTVDKRIRNSTNSLYILMK
jgi:hypothetical protein